MENISFNISDYFGHMIPSYTNMYFGDNFRRWLFDPSQNKKIQISKDLENLTEYVPSPGFESTKKNILWAFLYLLTVKPELGKQILKYELDKDEWYVIHFKKKFKKKKVVCACFLSWFSEYNAWAFDADICDDGLYPGRIYLSTKKL